MSTGLLSFPHVISKLRLGFNRVIAPLIGTSKLDSELETSVNKVADDIAYSITRNSYPDTRDWLEVAHEIRHERPLVRALLETIVRNHVGEQHMCYSTDETTGSIKDDIHFGSLGLSNPNSHGSISPTSIKLLLTRVQERFPSVKDAELSNLSVDNTFGDLVNLVHLAA